MTIHEFEKTHNLKLGWRLRETFNDVTVSFYRSGTKSGIFLEGAYGYGQTKEETLKRYCVDIRGKLLVVNDPDRREIWVPDNLTIF